MGDPVDPRAFPDRPIIAVSAAIVRRRELLVVRRARSPARGLWTFPGGVVEAGETLMEAAAREALEETALMIEPVCLAGHREVIARNQHGQAARHFVILSFAARWLDGEVSLNEELVEARWVPLASFDDFETTEGLADIAASALRLIGET